MGSSSSKAKGPTKGKGPETKGSAPAPVPAPKPASKQTTVTTAAAANKPTSPTQQPAQSTAKKEAPQPPKPQISVVKDNSEDAYGLLLCGAGESGKTTFTRQLKLKFLGGFTEEERIDYLRTMRGNLIESMQYLVSWCDKQQIEIKDDDVRRFSEEIVDEDPFECSFDDEIVEKLKVLWECKEIQTAFKHTDQIPIPDHISYFFGKIDSLASDGYVPTNEDVLKARIRTIGIEAITFDLQGARIRIFDVGGQKNERSKWPSVYEQSEGIIFCVSLADFDKPMFEDPSVLRIHDSLEIFGKLVHQQNFQHAPIFLLCNKLDNFAEKIKNTDSFISVFPEYKGDEHDVDSCVSYIIEKFNQKAEPLSESRPITPFKISALRDDQVVQTATDICKFISDHYFAE